MTYDFTSKNKMWLTIGMLVGVLCLGWTYFMADDALHTRFWSNFLHNAVFFTGIALMGGFFMSASITAWAGWYVNFKRVWESFSLFLLVGLGLMGIIALGVFFGWHHLYHWMDTSLLDPANEHYDKILAGKAGFLNKYWYLFGTVILIGIWLFIVSKIRSLSLSEDQGQASDFGQHRKIRIWAAAFLPLAGFGSAAMIWQWIMSVDAHWYSTLFGWYTGASWFVSMICLTILVLLYLKSKGYYQSVSTEHFHDLGKFLFAFSIFWTYLWFSQYMLIWYANVGEETIYFKERLTNYKGLFYINLLINFVAPFLILMRNDTKRKMGSLGFTAGLVLFGHWLDFFLMIKPGVLHTAHESVGHGHAAEHHGEAVTGHGHEGGHEIAEAAAHHVGEHASSFEMGFSMPGLLELGTFIGFLCLFLFFVFNTLSKTKLVGENDPYLEESIHHHT
ncbi:MAG: hypothetical protein HKN67_00330 [Saprospiraceae bacterium]|nr:hypothetical protein [Bacteroidia bacterium]NNF20362.1 hypothetical protein [Saprospiraceae bacterium]